MLKFKKYIILLLMISLSSAGGICLPLQAGAQEKKCDPSLEDCINNANITMGSGQMFLNSIVGDVYETNNVREYTFISWIGALTFLFISLLAAFFAIKLIYAGFLWMTANGNDDQIGKSKGILINSIVGLLIVLSAFAISWYILDKIGNKTIKQEAASQKE
ncbi:MAG: hypothetical protein V1860_00820 [bacterium]